MSQLGLPSDFVRKELLLHNGYDPLKSRRCGRCFGRLSNRDTTGIRRAFKSPPHRRSLRLFAGAEGSLAGEIARGEETMKTVAPVFCLAVALTLGAC